MKIVILGSKGFVGRNLTQHLSKTHHVFPLSRGVINLLDFDEVTKFLKEYNPDVVINAAATMTQASTISDARNNLGIFMNFYNNRHLFGRFLNLGSGAEFDRSKNINIASSEDIFNILPEDSYGFGQNIKARLSVTTENFFNLRIFNCFGWGEIQTRIFPKFIHESEPLTVDDRLFDYFSIQDLCTVVDYYVTEHEPKYKDINCVYRSKKLISDTMRIFKEITGINKKIVVTSMNQNNYTGDPKELFYLGLELLELEKSFKLYAEKVHKNV
jgi:GDP-L-fucose synthase